MYPSKAIDVEDDPSVSVIRAARIFSHSQNVWLGQHHLGLYQECNGKFSDIDGILEILINESKLGRKEIMDELESIKRRLDG